VHEIGRHPEIDAAFLHGSVTWLDDEEDLAPTSDIDVILVADDPISLAAVVGKRMVDGLVVDISTLSWSEIDRADKVLGAHHLASSLRERRSVLFDRQGWLTAVQALVGENFADPIWIGRRCDAAITRIRQNLAALPNARKPEQWAMAWLFGCGVTTHVYLVAGLRNPTVRNRYPMVREMLADLGLAHLYLPLLDLLNPGGALVKTVTSDLDFLETLFSAAASANRTRFPYSGDISASGRRGAITASRVLIEQGLQREALFWIGVTATRCMTILAADAAKTYEASLNRYLELLSRFGIGDWSAADRRASDILRSLPEIRANADLIMQRAIAQPGWAKPGE